MGGGVCFNAVTPPGRKWRTLKRKLFGKISPLGCLLYIFGNVEDTEKTR